MDFPDRMPFVSFVAQRLSAMVAYLSVHLVRWPPNEQPALLRKIYLTQAQMITVQGFVLKLYSFAAFPT